MSNVAAYVYGTAGAAGKKTKQNQKQKPVKAHKPHAADGPSSRCTTLKDLAAYDLVKAGEELTRASSHIKEYIKLRPTEGARILAELLPGLLADIKRFKAAAALLT
jgi:hypothetical protein